MMRLYKLTDAFVQRISNLHKTDLQISLLDIKAPEKFPYILIIQSTIENSIKLSIYPLKRDKIIKIIFFGFDFSNKIFNEIAKILQNYQVIHTTGVLLIDDKLLYECYLNMSLSDPSTKELNLSLNKIKNIFKEIKIEEIGLKKAK